MSLSTLSGDTPQILFQQYLFICILQTCKFANALKNLGVKKGDRVAIYMPMVVELVVAMLACARIGAIHSIVVSLLSLFTYGDTPNHNIPQINIFLLFFHHLKFQ